MSKKKIVILIIALLVLVGVFCFFWLKKNNYQTEKAVDMPVNEEINEDYNVENECQTGYDCSRIEVKFRAETDLSEPINILPLYMTDQIVSIKPISPLSNEESKKLNAENLKFWFYIKLKQGIDGSGFISDLKKLDSVENANFLPLPQLLP